MKGRGHTYRVIIEFAFITVLTIIGGPLVGGHFRKSSGV